MLAWSRVSQLTLQKFFFVRLRVISWIEPLLTAEGPLNQALSLCAKPDVCIRGFEWRGNPLRRPDTFSLRGHRRHHLSPLDFAL
jgi:hypothetical protein